MVIKEYCQQHEWVVFSTALEDRCLMVQCVECGSHGAVQKPTKKEWSKAHHAPSQPYRWPEDGRVDVRGRSQLYVVRKTNSKECPCPLRHRPRDYERVPAEITGRTRPLAIEEIGTSKSLRSSLKRRTFAAGCFRLLCGDCRNTWVWSHQQQCERWQAASRPSISKGFTSLLALWLVCCGSLRQGHGVSGFAFEVFLTA